MAAAVAAIITTALPGPQPCFDVEAGTGLPLLSPNAVYVLGSALDASSGLGPDPGSVLGSHPKPSPNPWLWIYPYPVSIKSSDPMPGYNTSFVASPDHSSGPSPGPNPVPSFDPNSESHPYPGSPTHETVGPDLPTGESQVGAGAGALLGPNG